MLYPSATNSRIGGRQWAASPTGVAVVTRGPSIGLLLANQLWSLGDKPDGRERINQTFVQAALAYTTPMRTTLFMSTESTYDYTLHRGTVPLQLGVNQLLRVGGRRSSLAASAATTSIRRPEVRNGASNSAQPSCFRSKRPPVPMTHCRDRGTPEETER